MTRRHRRDPHKEQFWREKIEQQQASGQTIRVFCLEHQISEANFHSWRREIHRRDSETPQPQSAGTREQAVFVPIELTTQETVSSIEIVLPDQTTIRLTGTVDQTSLGCVLQTLGGGHGCSRFPPRPASTSHWHRPT